MNFIRIFGIDVRLRKMLKFSIGYSGEVSMTMAVLKNFTKVYLLTISDHDEVSKIIESFYECHCHRSLAASPYRKLQTFF